MSLSLAVNGKTVPVDVAPDTPLMWVIRDVAKLKGTKFGCGIGVCGACTVLIDGAAVRSCSVSVGDTQGTQVTTIEGLIDGGRHPLAQAWIAEQAPQCGYCQPGFIMAAAALIKDVPKPTDQDINEQITNVCRCGTYPRIRKAIHRAAAAMAKAKA